MNFTMVCDSMKIMIVNNSTIMVAAVPQQPPAPLTMPPAPLTMPARAYFLQLIGHILRKYILRGNYFINYKLLIYL
jgi:hypothetical protein